MKTIPHQTWFKPMDIAKMGLIQSSKGNAGTLNGHYNFILDLIKAGQLKARNYSRGPRPYYLVSKKEIARYHENISV